MSVGDLVRNVRHPHAGIGIVTFVYDEEGALVTYAMAVFPAIGKGPQMIYGDEAEVISERQD
jgi:hypothetical protein